MIKSNTVYVLYIHEYGKENKRMLQLFDTKAKANELKEFSEEYNMYPEDTFSVSEETVY